MCAAGRIGAHEPTGRPPVFGTARRRNNLRSLVAERARPEGARTRAMTSAPAERHPRPRERRLAAAAILVTADGRYLLQLRDRDRPIWFPGFWGLFGGALEPGETPEQALVRELDEELGLRIEAPRYFCEVSFDTGDPCGPLWGRTVYEVVLDPAGLDGLVLREGERMELFDRDAILREQMLTPYDALALKLHAQRFGWAHMVEAAAACDESVAPR